MTTFTLIRHGETIWNTQGRLQGSQDSALTSKGIAQAQRCQQQLKATQFDTAYCSPRTRAKDTLDIILHQRQLPYRELDALREIHLGELEGKNKYQLPLPLQHEYDHFWQQPDKYQPINGETFIQAKTRMINCLGQLTNAHPNQHILIVSHMVVIALVIAHYQATPLSQLWRAPTIGNGQATRLHISNELLGTILDNE